MCETNLMRPHLTTSTFNGLAVATLALGWSAVVSAHDFWLEPAVFNAEVGTPVPVRLRVGEDFNGTSQPYIKDWFIDFSVTSPGGREPVTGFAGDDPAATLVLKSPGLRLIGYRSARSFVELDAEPFEAYLQAEGLERIRDLRRERGESQLKGREYYSRCSKSLLAVGPGPGGTSGTASNDTVYNRELGYTLELILLANPHELAPGDALPVVVHHLGRPLAGALVVAFTADSPAQKHLARSGADGRVTVPLDRAGRWLIKTVHMIDVPDTDPEADWESFWASLTFELRDPGTERRTD